MIALYNSAVTLTANLGLGYASLATVGYTLYKGDGSLFQARTTGGVTEQVAGTGMYRVQLSSSVFPAAFSGYVVWDTGGTSPVYATEDIYVTDQIGAIRAKTDLIGTAGAVLISPLVQSDKVVLIQGDDYLNADGRALTWTDTDTAWPSLTGATVVFDVSHDTGTFTATVVDANTVRLELTAAQTSTIRVGLHRFALKATLSNGHVVTLVAGSLIVEKRVDD